MRKIILLLLLGLAVTLLGVGCASDKGSREYIPGKGWVPTEVSCKNNSGFWVTLTLIPALPHRVCV
jgi:hypothetical protein